MYSCERVPPPTAPDTVEWLLGEILTNLYVGLMRLRRGERLSAQRFIQRYAVDSVMQLCSLIEPPLLVAEDLFDRSRRFEQRFPHIAHHLPRFLQGYDHSAESAIAILEFLEWHFPVNAAMVQRIREHA
jgi:lincosamide nucleotidyltransferase B/F